ncbi:glycoside hydrolase family 12 protein [Mycena rosella]|uniref:Glycoside hydrolase family 12 protein n=1 Tax=Mycena rosella TaxID=1033263 RepID=A0AAD7GUD0_MYCRO|nr:glycoside hydrolase family 12 protein [Mycena rosella]
MFALAKLSVLLLLVPFIAASPTPAVEERATAIDTTSHCGQWDSIAAGGYSLLLDQWGLSGASSGSDCASLTTLTGTTLAWKTTWTWTGGTGVKSFTNIQANSGINKQLSAIASIPSVWTWSQSSSGSIVADIAYDLFTSSTSGGSAVNEIMIWLANFNAGPISAVYNSAGQPVPKVSNVSLGGHTWNLYFGSNGANNVYSFLPVSGTIPSFNADINLFLKYLTANQGVSTSQFLTTAQGGTEATSGSATLTTYVFHMLRIFESQN